MSPRPPSILLFPYTTLFRSPEPTIELVRQHAVDLIIDLLLYSEGDITLVPTGPLTNIAAAIRQQPAIIPKIREISLMGDRKSTRLNSNHVAISYAVFCLKKK